MPFKDLPEGETHSYNDGCGEPAHNDMLNNKQECKYCQAYKSHSCCWEQGEKSACGIPVEKHARCCLCECRHTPKEQESKYEEVMRVSNETAAVAHARMYAPPKEPMDKPAESNWEEEFDKNFLMLMQGTKIEFFDMVEYKDKLKSFISKIRQEAIDQAYSEGLVKGIWDSDIEKIKDARQSLLKELEEEIGGRKKIIKWNKVEDGEECDTCSIMPAEAEINGHYCQTYNSAIDDILSILKGKGLKE